MKKYILDNGLTVLLDKIDFFKSFAMGFWVKVGSAYENEAINGYTHLLEHMLFKGTKQRSYFEISYAIECLGGYLNAFTTKEHTCFHVNLLSGHQDVGIDILWDMLHNSTIRTSELEKEKLVIIEEIKSTQDNPEELIYDIFAQEFWKGFPQSYPILGNIDNISLANREGILDFFNKYYVPDNIVVSIAGLFEEKSLLTQIERLNMPISNGGLKSANRIKENEVSFSEYHRGNSALEQLYIILAFKAPSRMTIKRFPLFVLSNILGEGSSSRLFVELREKRGLCYSIYSFCSLNEYNGVLGISLSTSPNKRREVIDSLFLEIDTLVKDGIEFSELVKAKEQLKSGIIFSYENLESRMNINTKNELYYNRFINIDETIDNIDSVSLNDVNELIKDLLGLRAYSLVSLGKKV